MLLTLREALGGDDDPWRLSACSRSWRACAIPARGCPWDLQQDFRSIAPHTLEEAYEVADAIEQGDLEQAARRARRPAVPGRVPCAARLANSGAFAFDDVVDAICDKLTRRHPHVFGDAVVADAAEQTAAWERMKREERAARGDAGALADVPDGTAGTDARAQARRAGGAGRLRLARRGRAARQGRRGAGGARRRARRGGSRGARGGTRGSPVLGGEPRAPPATSTRNRRCGGPTSASPDAIATSNSNSTVSASRSGSASPELLDRLWTAAKAENP